MTNSPLIAAIEDEIARSMAHRVPRRITIRRRIGDMALLLDQVAAETVPRGELLGKCRGSGTVRARWLFMVLAADLFHKSPAEIGRFLAVDRTTVNYGLERARAILAEHDERAFAIKYNRIAALWT